MDIQQKNNLLLNELMAPQIGNSFAPVGSDTSIGMGAVAAMPAAGTPAAAMPAVGALQQAAPQAAPQSDSDRRQAEIANAEAIRMKKAQERLARRDQNGAQPRSSNRSTLPPQFTGGQPAAPYSIESLIKPEVAQAEAKIGEKDRKPMGQWGKADWSKMLLSIGQGFGNSKDSTFASGLTSASLAANNQMQGQDVDAAAWDDRQRRRIESLNDMTMEEEIRHRRTQDERAYDQNVRSQVRGERREDMADERNYRREETADERSYRDREQDEARAIEKAALADQRTYNEGLKKEERALSAAAATAAAKREDAKAVREAAGKMSRNYTEDFMDYAKEIQKAGIEAGTPVQGEELTNLVLEQMRAAYGMAGGLGAPAGGNVIPSPRGLRSGLE